MNLAEEAAPQWYNFIKHQYKLFTYYKKMYVLTIDPIAGESKNITKAKKLKTRPASETVISFFSAWKK